MFCLDMSWLTLRPDNSNLNSTYLDDVFAPLKCKGSAEHMSPEAGCRLSNFLCFKLFFPKPWRINSAKVWTQSLVTPTYLIGRKKDLKARRWVWSGRPSTSSFPHPPPHSSGILPALPQSHCLQPSWGLRCFSSMKYQGTHQTSWRPHPWAGCEEAPGGAEGRCCSQADDFWFWDFAYNDAGKVRAFRSFFKIMNVDNSLKDDILQVENSLHSQPTPVVH